MIFYNVKKKKSFKYNLNHIFNSNLFLNLKNKNINNEKTIYININMPSDYIY